MLTESRSTHRSLALRLAVCACPLILTLPASATITVSGDPGQISPADPTSWTSSTAAQVGIDAGATGVVALDGGSLLTSSTASLGHNSGSTGTLSITGAGSSWTNSNVLYVGNSGTGTMTLGNGGNVSSGSAGPLSFDFYISNYIGANAASTGTATVTDPGSRWTTYNLCVGRSGNGTLNVENGGVVISNGSPGSGFPGFANSNFIGLAPGSTGSVTVTGAGSTWTCSGSMSNLLIGHQGTGTLTIANGGTVSTNSAGSTVSIGGSLGGIGNVAVTGAGSTWTAGNVSLGDVGTGTLTIQNGGTVNSALAIIGSAGSVAAAATVTGAGSTWTTRLLALAGSGTLTVQDGASVTATTLLSPSLNGFGGNGTINAKGLVSDLDLVFDATHGAQQALSFGTGGVLNLDLNGTGNLGVGYNGHGTMTVAGGVLAKSTSGYLGRNSGSSGTATITGGGSSWTNSSDLSVGSSGSGSLRIENGGTVSAAASYIGSNSGSSGNVAVTGIGSNLTSSGSLYVGSSGSGSLRIESGGTVSNATGYIGQYAGSTGTVAVSGTGSKWTNSPGIGYSLSIGYAGNGELTVGNGGQVTGGDGSLGYSAGSTGSVTVTGTGSSWTSARNLSVGLSGTGTLRIDNGGNVSNAGGVVASESGAVGTVTVTGGGSTWTNSDALLVGKTGRGTMRIENGGVVTVGIWNSGYIGYNSGSTGTVTVTGSGSRWTMGSELDVGYMGTGTLTIEHGGQVLNNYGYLGQFSSSTGEATVTGAGSTWTNRNGLYLGTNGSTGTLTIADGGRVTAQDLGIRAGSSLNLHVSGSDMLVLGSAATIGSVSAAGAVNLYADASLAPGTYTPVSDLQGRRINWIRSAGDAFGGTWDDTTNTFTVAAALAAAAGDSAPVATGQRLTITDATGTRHIGVSFGVVPDGSTFSATPMTADQLTSLTLAPGQSVASAWDFTTNLAGSTVLLSFDVGPDASNLQAWHYTAGAWTPVTTDLTYANGIASFTVNSFSGYAVTAAVPEPTTLSLLALSSLTLLRRRQGRRPMTSA